MLEKCSKLHSEGGNRIDRVDLPYIPLPEVVAHVPNAKGFNCLAFGRIGTVFSAPALGLDEDYFSVCKTQLDYMHHCVPTPGLLCNKAKLELDLVFQSNNWITTGLLLDWFWSRVCFLIEFIFLFFFLS